MRVYLETYGCTANKNDESIAIGILKREHHKIVDEIEKADVLVLLTCTVIGTTEQRMLSRLRKFKKTNKKIIVTGCMPNVQSELIKSIVPNASLLPTQHIKYINFLIKDRNIPIHEEKNIIIPKHFKSLSAPISIANGCLFSCSYCITHFARGRLRSFPHRTIISDVKQAINQGCKEIFLTAQDTASYGFDINDDLGSLLKNICKLECDFRIRVGMMNPYAAQKNINSILSAYKHLKIYKFLHLPVQSGDNNILKQMNRKYKVEDFKKIITKFRTKYPHLTLSTDIIVGFPGETERQFKKSIELIKKIQPDILNITRFSARPMTEAKTMKERIPTKIVKERSRTLTKISKEISRELNEHHIGKEYHILITKNKDDLFIGRTDNYKPVLIQEKVKVGEFSSVKIVDSDNIHLFGKLI
jgi:MiaB-like tRNA modifying enzyme